MNREELLQEVEKEFGPGCAAICKERARQKDEKGFDVERDKELYNEEQLAAAAIAYAVRPNFEFGKHNRKFFFWPWNFEFWKPTPDNRQREFEKSGGLMAAQLDVTISKNKTQKS